MSVRLKVRLGGIFTSQTITGGMMQFFCYKVRALAGFSKLTLENCKIKLSSNMKLQSLY